MEEKDIKLLVNFFRLIEFYELDNRIKGGKEICEDIVFFYETAVELANKILKERNILELSTPKAIKFAEVIRFLKKENALEDEVINVFIKLSSRSLDSNERKKLNYILSSKEEIKKYKGL